MAKSTPGCEEASLPVDVLVGLRQVVDNIVNHGDRDQIPAYSLCVEYRGHSDMFQLCISSTDVATDLDKATHALCSIKACISDNSRAAIHGELTSASPDQASQVLRSLRSLIRSLQQEGTEPPRQEAVRWHRALKAQ